MLRNKYGIFEIINNIYSLILTKLFCSRFRLLRRPIYIRGKKSIDGGNNLTTGYSCRFDLQGQKKTLILGNNISMGDYCHIVALNNVKIGNNVLMASKIFISDTDHGVLIGENQEGPNIVPAERRLTTGMVSIGDNVWIGENVVILSGAKIGSGCILGANCIVTGSIPDNSVVVGCNKIIKRWNEVEGKWVKTNQ